MHRRNTHGFKVLGIILFFTAMGSGYFFSQSEIRGFDYLKLDKAHAAGSRIPASAEVFPQVVIEETHDPAFRSFYRIIDKENHVICYASRTDTASSMSCVNQKTNHVDN